MTETRGEMLTGWLLIAVIALGESATRANVHEYVRGQFGHLLTEEDQRPRVGRPGEEEAWRNNLDSLYDRLKKTGLMQGSNRGDCWRLTEIGLAMAIDALRSEETLELQYAFSPKDAADYLAHVEGKSLVKRREHEALLRVYGEEMISRGWQCATNVHPRDLEMQSADGDRWLVEVKMVYLGNATAAVRAALAQLLEYRFLLYRPSTVPRLLALFSEGVGYEYERFLESLGILTVWRTDEGWGGSRAAVNEGLVPRSMDNR